MKGFVVLKEYDTVIDKDKYYDVLDLEDLSLDNVSGDVIYKAVFNNMVFHNLTLKTGKRYNQKILLDSHFFNDKILDFGEDVLIYYRSKERRIFCWVRGYLWDIPSFGFYGLYRYLDCLILRLSLSYRTLEFPIRIHNVEEYVEFKGVLLKPEAISRPDFYKQLIFRYS